MPEINRPLSPMEYGLWFMDFAARSNFMFVAELNGRISAPSLEAAARAIACRHPLLNTAIIIKNKKQPFFVPAKADPPVKIDSQMPEKNALPRLLEEENHQRINTDTGPLFRIRLLDGGERQILLLILHHAVTDGVCGSHILQDLLSAADKFENNHKPDPDIASSPGPMEEHLDKSHKGLIALSGALTTLLAQGFSKNILRRFSFPLLDNPTPVDQRKQCFVLRSLNEKETARLMNQARENNTGVHAVLCAAQLMAMAAEISGKKAPLIPQLTLVDMRKRLSPNVDPGATGVYISSVESAHRVNPDQSLWKLAREVQKDILTKMVKEEHFTYWPSLMRLMHLGRLTHSHDAKGAAAALRQGEIVRPAAAITSNLGRIDGKTEYTSFTVDRMYFLMAISGSGYFSCSTNAFNGRLHLNFTHAYPDISRELAETIADKTCDVLREC